MFFHLCSWENLLTFQKGCPNMTTATGTLQKTCETSKTPMSHVVPATCPTVLLRPIDRDTITDGLESGHQFHLQHLVLNRQP